jgi:1-phosphatidylinositol-3-phosphate 5-kinase
MTLGTIDYVRQYTWERRIETGVKSMGMITGKASPTVISPENYKVRFQLATERYFMMAPCQTSQAGLKLSSAEKNRKKK